MRGVMARAGVQPAALQSGLAEVLLKRGRGERKTTVVGNAGIVEIEPARRNAKKLWVVVQFESHLSKFGIQSALTGIKIDIQPFA